MLLQVQRMRLVLLPDCPLPSWKERHGSWTNAAAAVADVVSKTSLAAAADVASWTKIPTSKMPQSASRLDRSAA